MVAPRSLSAAERVGERVLVGQVDAGGRLVEDEQVRARRPARGRSAPAAAGRRTAAEIAVAGAGRQADDVERLARSRPGRLARAAAAAGGARAGPEATTSHTEAGTPEAAPLRCGTKPIRCQSWNAPSGVPNRLSRPGRERAAARSAPGPAWTCRSRWRPAARRTRPRRTVRSTPRRTGRPPMATAPSGSSTGRVGQLTASVRLLQGGQVGPHQREVVLVGGLVGQSLDRVEDRRRRRRGRAASVSVSRGLASALGEDGRDALLAMSSCRSREVGGRRLGAGGEAGDRLHVETVRSPGSRTRRGETTTVVALAVGQPGRVRRVERRQVGAQVGGVGGVRRRRARGRPRRAGRRAASPSCGHPQRVEPEVRVRRRSAVVGESPRPRRRRTSPSDVLRGRVVDGRLEAALGGRTTSASAISAVCAAVSSRSCGSLPGLWSGSPPRRAVADHPLGEVLQGVERRHDLERGRAAPRVVGQRRAAGQRERLRDTRAVAQGATDAERCGVMRTILKSVENRCQTCRGPLSSRAGREQVPGARATSRPLPRGPDPGARPCSPSRRGTSTAGSAATSTTRALWTLTTRWARRRRLPPGALVVRREAERRPAAGPGRRRAVGVRDARGRPQRVASAGTGADGAVRRR